MPDAAASDLSPCPGCEHGNPADARFCNSCGTPLHQVCASCEHQNPSGARFCNSCGKEMLVAPERDPRQYTPRHLADKILTAKSALEGERKQLTVLFADVKGSMSMSEAVDPEGWHEILDGFFSVLADGVHRFEGTINQYTGDGIMALFGAPIAHEDHAQRACYAALQLRVDLQRYAREVKREHGLAFSVRMGVHSGEVVVGKIGDDLRMDYTAQGHTVGLAARMQELASPDTIYLTEATADLVQGYFELEDLGTFSVKGVSDPVGVFQMQGIGEIKTRFDASRARGLSRFVGRTDDMQTLETALSRSRSGQGQVVGVVADAGVGKSRLCFEFLERCKADGLRVLKGAGVAHGKNLALLPIMQVFREYYGISEHDSDQLVREKIAGRMLLFDEEYRDVLPILFEFFGAPDPDNPAPRMDPEARQRQLFGVLRRVTQRDASQGALVILIEDLHWIDEASEAWVEEWVDAIGGATDRLLILNFRPEYHADWMQKSWYQQLPLMPLGPDAIRELLEDLLGEDESIGDLADAIHARTAGNPFFTEEVVQTLVESRHLVGDRGSYRLATPIDKLEVPTRVQPVLAARIDRLPEREKSLLQTAAVIGTEFPEPILKAVAELPDDDLGDALRSLKMGEFIYEQALFPVAEYAFKHPLTQQVALDSQLRERRRRIHKAVASTIEAAHSEKLDEQAALLAHHWEEAGQDLIAASWHSRAAEHTGTTDMAQSFRHLERVRHLVRKFVEQDVKAAKLGADACRRALALGFRLGLSEDEGAALFDEGKQWAAQANDNDVAGLLECAFSISRVTKGDVARGLEHAEAGAGLLAESSNDELRSLANWTRSYPRLILGELQQAAEDFDQMIENTEGHLDWGIDVWDLCANLWARFMRGAVEVYIGELPEAKRLLDAAIARLREHDERESEGWALGWATDLAYLSGDVDAALALAQRGVESSVQLGSPYSRVHTTLRLGLALLMAEREGEAARVLDDVIDIARKEGTAHEIVGRAVAYRGEAALRLGDEEAAEALARDAVANTQKAGAAIDEVYAQRVLAIVLLARHGAGASDEIRAALDRGQELCEHHGITTLPGLLALVRADLAQAQGDQAGREACLREALERFRSTGAEARAAQVETLLD
jgi:class 3 adenylate cyclase